MRGHSGDCMVWISSRGLSAYVAVRRNRVKFWFIKNYMSPQMKRFVPHMARRYSFAYEFVTYRWPSWLHQQVSGLLDVLIVDGVSQTAKDMHQTCVQLLSQVTRIAA